MLNWLYTHAKHFKKIAFAVSGGSVAVSIATSLVFPAISWISNLVAVVGGGAYSSFKNMETAKSVMDDQREAHQLAERVSLQKYQPAAHHIPFPDILERIAPNRREAGNIIAAMIPMEDELKKAKRYAVSNLFIQLFLSAAVIVVNAIANSEESDKKSDALTTKNMLNMIAVPIFILFQYIIHTTCVAKNLRCMAKKAETSKSTLLRARDSLLFRSLETHMFFQHRAEIKQTLKELKSQIARKEAELRGLEINVDAMKYSLAEMYGLGAQEEQHRLESEMAELEEYIRNEQGLLQQKRIAAEELESEKESLKKDKPKFKQAGIDIATEARALI